MNYLSTQSMITMRYVPQLDRNVVGYAVSWILAIAVSTICVAVYA